MHPDGSANRNNYIWIKEITPNAKTESVFVTGATGNQGGAAVRHLLSKGFHIKALVRNPDAIPAQLIRQNNVEIIKGI